MAAKIQRIFLICVAPPKTMLKESIFFPISPNACITHKKKTLPLRLCLEDRRHLNKTKKSNFSWFCLRFALSLHHHLCNY